MITSAVVEGQWRYRLDRIWVQERPKLHWIMLNPSTADAHRDDATIRKCMGFAARNGFGGISVYNLFAFRSPDPWSLNTTDYPVGPKNDEFLRALRDGTDPIIFAWGGHKMPRGHETRPGFVIDLFSPFTDEDQSRRVYCLGRCMSGAPRHPLMVPYCTGFERFYRG